MLGGEQLLSLFTLRGRAAAAMRAQAAREANLRGDAGDIDIAELAELNAMFGKFIMIAVASHFEAAFKRVLELWRGRIAEIGEAALVKKTGELLAPAHRGGFFSWREDEAAEFYHGWGGDLAAFMEGKEEEDDEFADNRRIFARIIQTRNKLLHSNLAAFPYEGSADELKQAYRRARRFIPRFLRYALEFARAQTGERPAAP